MRSFEPVNLPEFCQYSADATRCQLTLLGDICIRQADELKHVLDTLGDDPRLLEIDLAKITQVDTSGIQLFMAIRNHRQKQNLPLHLTQHSDAVLSAFSLFDLVRYFNDPIVMIKAGDDR